MIALASLPADDPFLMMKSYHVDGVQLDSLLGTGGSCTVYRGSLGRDISPKVCKIFGNPESFYREIAALTALEDVPNVPKIVTGELMTSDGEHVLVVTPVATLVAPVAKSKRVCGRHLKQLVEVVKAAHELHLCHRDIKPENMFLTSEGNLLLNDWGAAVFQDFDSPSQVPWIGTVRYNPRIEGNHTPSKELDLRCVVRSAFVLITAVVPPSDSTEQFWSNVMAADTNWADYLLLAETLNYDELGNQLAR